MTTVIGIDPGASGGIAWNSQGTGIQARAMPREEADVVALLREIIEANKDHSVVAYIELVTGYVVKDRGETCHVCGQPKSKGEPGSRMFTFGHGAGNIMGALRMAGIEPVTVAPRTWQKPYYVNLASESGARKSKSERKRILRDIAQRQFMGLEVTLKTADALLIQLYGSIQSGQELEGIVIGERPSLPVVQDKPKPFTKKFKRQFKKMVATVDAVTPAAGSNLFIGNFQGHDSVFRRDEIGGATFLHVADRHDLETLPRGTQF